MLKRSNMFRGFLLYLLVLIIIVSIFLFGVMRYFTYSIFSQIENELAESATLVSNMLVYMNSSGDFDYDGFCKTAGKTGGTRITIIAADGHVLGDSLAHVEDMNNHGDRPEVIQARQLGQGMSVRHSSSLGYRLMYLAKRQELPGEIGYLRTSRSISTIDMVISRTSRTLLLLGVLFFILAVYAATSTGQWIRRPLQRLVIVAEALGKGDLKARSDVSTPEEMRVLGQTLNIMAGRLAGRIESVQRQRDEYQLVLTGMSEAVVVLDSGLRVLETNRAAESIFQLRREEMVGHPLLKAVRNLKLHEFAEELLSGGVGLTEELTFHISEGNRVLYLQVHGAPLGEGDRDENLARAVLVFTDISEIRRSEAIRRDFVSNVSHELKTPITSIKGFVETLQDGAAEDLELLQRFLGIIQKQADSMHAIIEDLLQLSRLDERSITMVQAMVDLRDIMQAAAEKVRPAAEDKKMGLKLRESGPVYVRGNSGLLEQAVFNLMDNAVKYSDPGKGFSVALEAYDGEAQLSVSDSGVGIPEEDLPRIFERFYRVDKARSRETGGTGLGLAIVKHIVQVHGGRVTVESLPGKGSTFSIFLPALSRSPQTPS